MWVSAGFMLLWLLIQHVQPSCLAVAATCHVARSIGCNSDKTQKQTRIKKRWWWEERGKRERERKRDKKQNNNIKNTEEHRGTENEPLGWNSQETRRDKKKHEGHMRNRETNEGKMRNKETEENAKEHTKKTNGKLKNTRRA